MVRRGPVHSIYLTGSAHPSTELPHVIQKNIESFRFHHPDRDHILYTDDIAEGFLRDNFNKDVLDAFNALRPLAYKADLLRYCVLYVSGGIYADLALHFFNTVETQDEKITLFRDGFSQLPWIVSTSLIACPAGMPLFSTCIDTILEHVRTRCYGANALSPTGPNLFGKAVATTVPERLVRCGDVIKINRNARGHSYAYIDALGDLVAVSMKKGNGLASLGAAHSDDYTALYNRKAIYGRDEPSSMRWESFELVDRGWSQLRGVGNYDAGVVAYGPYIALAPGFFRARHSITSPDYAILHQSIKTDICHHSASSFIPHETSCSLSGTTLQVDTTFEVSEPVNDLEARLFLTSPAVLEAVDLEISRLQE